MILVNGAFLAAVLVVAGGLLGLWRLWLVRRPGVDDRWAHRADAATWPQPKPWHDVGEVP